MPIRFTPIDRDALKPGKNWAKKWLQQVAQIEKYTIEEITIAFCSDEYIEQANAQFLQHNYPTDIITFDQTTPENRKKRQLSADLLISIDQTKQNAKKYHTTPFDELCRVMVHGMLHLMQYNDQTPTQQTKMRARENYHLQHRPPFQ